MAISRTELTSEIADRVCPACGAKNLRTSATCYACGEAIPLHGDSLPAPRGGPLVGDDEITIPVAWRIGVNSLRLVARNRSLLVFPIVGGAAAIGALALLGLGLYSLHPNLSTLLFWAVSHPLWPILFAVAAYVTVVTVSTIALAGLIGASVLALQGGQPRARDGWRIARAHLGILLAWSLLDATVGLVLELVSRRLGILGAIAGMAGGIAWGLSTYFVVQVLVLEQPRIRPSIARSARIMRHLFGDVVFSDILAELLTAAGLILVIATLVVGTLETFVHGYAADYLLLGAVGVVAGTLLMILGATVAVVVQTGLFRYAVTGTLDPSLFSNALGRRAQSPGSQPTG
jgi:hypothetical protein